MSNTSTVFNPAIHAVDENGAPRLRKDGTYALKRGRKAGTTYAPGVTSKSGVIVNDVKESVIRRLAATGDIDTIVQLTALTASNLRKVLEGTPEWATAQELADKANEEAESAREYERHVKMGETARKLTDRLGKTYSREDVVKVLQMALAIAE